MPNRAELKSVECDLHHDLDCDLDDFHLDDWVIVWNETSKQSKEKHTRFQFNKAKIKYISVSGHLTYPKIFCRP